MSSIGLQSRLLIWLTGIIRSSNAVRTPFIPKHAGAECGGLQMTCFSFICPSGAGRAVSREGACLCQPPSAAETALGASKCLVLCSPQDRTCSGV